VRALCCPRPSAQSDLFAPAWAKGSRAQVVGSVREAPRGPPLRGALLVLFSRQGEKSTRTDLPDKPKYEAPLQKSREPRGLTGRVHRIRLSSLRIRVTRGTTRVLPIRFPMPWGMSAVRKPNSHQIRACSRVKLINTIWEGIHKNPKAKP